MFISALSVVMGAPPATAVTEYFDAFHATGAHLWQTGLPVEIDGWLDAGHPGFRYVTWVDQNGNSSANGQRLGGVAPRAGRIGYQIGDEPLDFAQLQTMQSGGAAALLADPSGLTILNLSPDGAKGPLATQGAAMPQFDVLSVDDYTYRRGAYQSLSGLRTAALANGKPYWRYLDGFRFTTQTDNSTESDYRWDAYVGATWGYTGHTWFIYQIDPGNPDLVPSFFTTKGVYGSARTAQFQWAATLNQQLASLGRTLSLLRSTDVRYVASLVQPAGTTAFTRGAGGDPYLTRVAPPSGTFADVALGFFVDDCGEHYLMVQSQRHQDADFPNSSQASTTFKVELDFAGAIDSTLDRTAVMVLDPVTDVIAPRALTSTGASTATLDLVLPAGGGVLLKYKNGRPFARQ